jgi:hypothetical protein
MFHRRQLDEISTSVVAISFPPRKHYQSVSSLSKNAELMETES